MSDDNPWRRAYRGSALVAFSSLKPQLGAQKSLDGKRVLKLCRIYQVEGCKRFDESNHIRALVTDGDLALYGRTITTTSSPYLNRLNTAYTVQYVHGRHRLAAAEAFLLAEDHWWPVDFYIVTGLSQDLTRRACDNFENSQPFSDGIIFRELLSSQSDAYTKIWLARLTESKRRDYRQLCRQQRLSPLLDAFRKLTIFEGLWHDFRLGTFHRILTLRCLEELVDYLHTVFGVWFALASAEHAGTVDSYTVRTLQGRAPYMSLADRNFITDKFKQGLLFSGVKDTAQRETLQSDCIHIQRIIPSLYTFMEDSKWIEPSCHILRKLTPFSRLNVRKALSDCFLTMDTTPNGTRFTVAYRKLWLFTLRHFADLDTLQPRLESRNGTVLQRDSSGVMWKVFTRYAVRLGFRIPNVADDDSTSYQHKPREPAQWTSTTHVPFKLKHRCGRMYDGAYMVNQAQLFYEDIYEAPAPATGPHIACFTIARDTFHAFLGGCCDQSLTIFPETEDESTMHWNEICDKVDLIAARGPECAAPFLDNPPRIAVTQDSSTAIAAPVDDPFTIAAPQDNPLLMTATQDDLFDTPIVFPELEYSAATGVDTDMELTLVPTLQLGESVEFANDKAHQPTRPPGKRTKATNRRAASARPLGAVNMLDLGFAEAANKKSEAANKKIGRRPWRGRRGAGQGRSEAANKKIGTSKAITKLLQRRTAGVGPTAPTRVDGDGIPPANVQSRSDAQSMPPAAQGPDDGSRHTQTAPNQDAIEPRTGEDALRTKRKRESDDNLRDPKRPRPDDERLGNRLKEAVEQPALEPVVRVIEYRGGAEEVKVTVCTQHAQYQSMWAKYDQRRFFPREAWFDPVAQDVLLVPPTTFHGQWIDGGPLPCRYGDQGRYRALGTVVFTEQGCLFQTRVLLNKDTKDPEPVLAPGTGTTPAPEDLVPPSAMLVEAPSQAAAVTLPPDGSVAATASLPIAGSPVQITLPSPGSQARDTSLPIQNSVQGSSDGSPAQSAKAQGPHSSDRTEELVNRLKKIMDRRPNDASFYLLTFAGSRWSQRKFSNTGQEQFTRRAIGEDMTVAKVLCNGSTKCFQFPTCAGTWTDFEISPASETTTNLGVLVCRPRMRQYVSDLSWEKHVSQAGKEAPNSESDGIL
ncbi:hypothetical protein LTR70_004876 [Exophiala xenobiotica]|uniref:Uncharacterized protein n=1 Tax=Lithohypha guttulata TaxID=1690604 RepID=A0ABR0KBV8_9EURO|nr:hypothetical protein LTR24_004494 [Lithohypha guttulata]KAK5319831.1 hypothetical protein LTR70_004876 [Exophiala xenobiotica]